MKEERCNNVVKPTVLMVGVQITFAGMNVLYKLAVNDGMNLRIVIAYRFLFATAFIAPLALILERNKTTKMTWTVLFQSFLCGLFGGSLAQNFYLESLAFTSLTFTSAMFNLTPAITFIIAVSLGLEKINLRRAGGKAKVLGTLIGIGGAMILTFIKGMEIKIGSFHLNLLHHQNGPHANTTTGGSKPVLGALCGLACSVCYALWLIIQAKMTKRYPNHYSGTALMSFWSSLLSIGFALCFERDLSQWRLGWNIRLLTVSYAGIVVSGVVVVVMSWCVHTRGPLFVSIFNPLVLVILAIVDSTMLNEKLHLGSIIGAVLIVCGLYAVLWGKSKEVKEKNQLVPSSQIPHASKSNTVEIVLRSAVEVEDKSNRNDNNNGVHAISN
ncbi:EamA domain [Sesbania bispinosa]|nr:EamA domain [Sesbania bispinosa]